DHRVPPSGLRPGRRERQATVRGSGAQSLPGQRGDGGAASSRVLRPGGAPRGSAARASAGPPLVGGAPVAALAWPSRPTARRLLQQQRPDVVQDERRVEEADAVHVPYSVLRVEQEDLQDVAEKSRPGAVLEAELGDRLVEVGEQRLQLGIV